MCSDFELQLNLIVYIRHLWHTYIKLDYDVLFDTMTASFFQTTKIVLVKLIVLLNFGIFTLFQCLKLQIFYNKIAPYWSLGLRTSKLCDPDCYSLLWQYTTLQTLN